MSREDVALLVFRTLALWVGSLGVVGIASAPLAFTAAGIPPLACFVVGLLQIAAAIPAGAEWFALRLMQYRDAGLMAPASDIGRAFDAQGVATGASVMARLAVGVALIVLSRRRDLWAAGNGETAD